MALYRKKPVVIEARRFSALSLTLDAAEFDHLMEWLGEAAWYDDGADELVIDTLEGSMRARPGDWIIRGVQGEFYPCKPDIFAATYDPIQPDGSGA